MQGESSDPEVIEKHAIVILNEAKNLLDEIRLRRELSRTILRSDRDHRTSEWHLGDPGPPPLLGEDRLEEESAIHRTMKLEQNHEDHT